MGLIVSGSGSASGTKLLDVWEAWDGYHTYNASGNATPLDFASGNYPNIFANAIMFSAVSGAAGAIAYDAAIGRSIDIMQSAAGIVGRGSAAPFGMPIRTRFALAGSPPLNWVPRPRRFRVDYVARVLLAGPAAALVGVGIDGSTMGSAAGSAMCVWESRPAVNAGRWMPRTRLVSAGAMVDGPDSGITAAAFHRLSIVYEEGPTPRVRWLLDDREVHQIAGDANMPSPPAGQFGPFLLGKNVSGAGAGTSFNTMATHFSIDEL